ncbi:MAG: 50S ribosomal protein L37e [Thermoplasmata archaeon]|nr:50S ribosomal protein L37e [Thermoplasmata archaeon]MCI4338141.1 50S ribosomal protein L37e [Thermoplasmata archaeon]MCI4341594.1 50S ribosomal protein L37e [Thermoplasmata archaeon]
MGKGTPARRGGKIVHFRCRRCGKHSFHRQKRVCASCGFGDSPRWRSFSWAKLR